MLNGQAVICKLWWEADIVVDKEDESTDSEEYFMVKGTYH